MPNYESLSPELTRRIQQDKAAGTQPKVGFDDQNILRRHYVPTDRATVWRPAFVHDIDKIIHCPYYNRYSDKTQVFSLIRNDDITRRSLHVQLVSRIARTIGSALHLNLDLIEAIALGHDMGHSPFAHSGEIYLDELYFAHAGRHFSHSIHSVRVLDDIFPLNVSLQVLDGIACHNGEIELAEYTPASLGSFAEFDTMIEGCYEDSRRVRKLMPSTLEGAVVRISDIIAYLGKDRQDAARMNIVNENDYDMTCIGSINAEIINNLVVNIIENSYGKPYIRLDDAHFAALKTAKQENCHRIYEAASTRAKLDTTAKPMMGEIYGQMLTDLRLGKDYSPIFRHHISYVNQTHYPRQTPYEKEEPNQIVVDYIASMTDDYLIDLHHYLFPDSSLRVEYTGYFDDQESGGYHV
ncbi:MAG: HD domain-containing protein [Oscillospiraceae bacterium]|nr:HD domain-containing protein [Oscillospiraceae bacterium]